MPRNRSISVLAACVLGLSATPTLAVDRIQTLLRSLTDAPGPSGYEEEIRAVIVREIKPFTTSISYDGMGSVIGQHGSAGPKIMLDAHMDELGGMVRRVTPTGFLSIQLLGGWLDQALPDQRWIVMTSKGPVHAVSGIRDIHLIAPEERDKVISRDQMFLDIGVSNPQEAADLGIEAGDPVVPDASFEVLNGTTRYLGKAWDDRIGCAVVIEAFRRLSAEGHPNQVFAALTVQEEVGARGAHSATAKIHPDIGISIESGVAGDVPVSRTDETQAKLGAGPTVFLYTFSELPNRRFITFIRDTATKGGIPVQLDLVKTFADDASEMQKSGDGIPVVNLGIPVRYTHAHNGIIDRADFDHTVDLVVALVKRLDAPTVKRLHDFSP